MPNRAQDLARGAVGLIASLLDSLRGQIASWIYGGDWSFFVMLVGVALVLMLFVVVPSRRRY